LNAAGATGAEQRQWTDLQEKVNSSLTSGFNNQSLTAVTDGAAVRTAWQVKAAMAWHSPHQTSPCSADSLCRAEGAAPGLLLWLLNPCLQAPCTRMISLVASFHAAVNKACASCKYACITHTTGTVAGMPEKQCALVVLQVVGCDYSAMQ
jgi:hypothetical protein